MKANKFIISGGGTGGHIFPAIAIADQLRVQYPNCEILFVGANGKMEMEKVPAAGYNIEGLDIAGFQRSLSPKNLSFPIKLYKSVSRAKKLVKQFQPDVAIGVGGYASGPTLYAAEKAGVPCVLQEQNSFPGITNRLLAKKAASICVAYNDMERFFQQDKITLTGNPVRSAILQTTDRAEAAKHFGLNPEKPILLSVGGSLGARSINDALANGKQKIAESDVQVIWQTGKWYWENQSENLKDLPNNLHAHQFIKEMNLALSAADLVISRAGALSITELQVTGKPCILVPSPYVAEDHQTKNAMALVKEDAAIMVTEGETQMKLVDIALNTLKNKEKLNALSAAISKMAKPNATKDIVAQIEKLL